MEEAIKGAILGGVIGIVLVAFEYLMLSKDAKERAERLHRKPELDEVAHRRIKTIARFAFVLPVLVGGIFWLIWG
jgi:Trk-type K+ transport system membrane component